MPRAISPVIDLCLQVLPFKHMELYQSHLATWACDLAQAIHSVERMNDPAQTTPNPLILWGHFF